MQDLVQLQHRLGYTFCDEYLLRQALTHSSYVNENREKDPLTQSNERLEFLGDAILQQTVSVELYHLFPDLNEGTLTQFRQHLVCEGTLARVADRLDLGSYLFVGRGVEGDRRRPKLLADALEALLAAVYLDARDTHPGACEALILRLLSEELDACRRLRGGDYKTRMMQLVQGDGEDILTYEVVSESGPAHDRCFEVVARLNSNVVGHGHGKTKKEAEQMAAREALALFGITE